MLRSIIGTFSSKLLTTGLNFIILLLQAQFLGAEGKGAISLFIASLTIIQHLNDIIGGTAVVYLAPRIKAGELLWPGYIWAVVTGVGGSALLYFSGQTADGEWLHLLWLSILLSLFSINLKFLLGKEKVGWFNILSVIQVIATIAPFAYMVFVEGSRDYTSFIYSLYVAYAICFVLSTLSVIKLIGLEWSKISFRKLKEVINFGFIGQLSNIINFFNYRFSYYLIDAYIGRAELGVYSMAINVMEGLWLIGRSISLVQYTKVANETEQQNSIRLTDSFTKINFWFLVVGLLFILAIPNQVYAWVFGPEFISIKLPLYYLAPGILIFGFGFTLTSFFSGKGLYMVNNIAAAFALVFTLGLGFWLIPTMGVKGAGISTSVAYAVSALYVYYRYTKHSSFRLHHLVHLKEEWQTLRRAIS